MKAAVGASNDARRLCSNPWLGYALPKDKGAARVQDWPVYVINMDSNETRLARVGAELDGAGVAWTRLPAVNGRALSEGALARVYDVRANRRYARHDLVPPEIGCYLSHIKAAEWLLESGAEAAVVLEDDLRITGDFAANLSALQDDLQKRPAAWDMVKLFSFKPVRLDQAQTIGQGFTLGRPDRVPSTTLGYVLTRAGAEKILAKVPPIFRPVDEDHKHFWEFDLRVSMIAPQTIAIGAQETSDGTVGDSRKKMAQKDPIWVRLWRFGRYRVNYRLHLARARTKGL